MAVKKPKNNKNFKVKDYMNSIALMKKKNDFSGKAMAEIAEHLGIPQQRVYRYKKKYLAELGVDPEIDLNTETGEEKTVAVILETNIAGKFGDIDMQLVADELDKLSHFKWDGMNFMLHCINEFKVKVSDPDTALEDKIKLFKLIAPYIASVVPQNEGNIVAGESLTVANIYNQAQQFYQQSNFISNETTKNSSKGNKKK